MQMGTCQRNKETTHWATAVREAFPEEVAPQEVEYEMTRSMSEGWRGIESEGTMHMGRRKGVGKLWAHGLGRPGCWWKQSR